MIRFAGGVLAIWSGWCGAAPMPDCALTRLNGREPVSLRELQRGKVLYVDFWASWCTSCVKSFPFMAKLDRDLKDRGFAVIAINLDETAQDAAQFLERHPVDINLLVDGTKACAQAFGVKGMPATYLIDHKGEVRFQHIGFRASEAGKIRQKVEELVAEREGSPP